jgi:hypothetical protein
LVSLSCVNTIMTFCLSYNLRKESTLPLRRTIKKKNYIETFLEIVIRKEKKNYGSMVEKFDSIRL